MVLDNVQKGGGRSGVQPIFLLELSIDKFLFLLFGLGGRRLKQFLQKNMFLSNSSTSLTRS